MRAFQGLVVLCGLQASQAVPFTLGKLDRLYSLLKAQEGQEYKRQTGPHYGGQKFKREQTPNDENVLKYVKSKYGDWEPVITVEGYEDVLDPNATEKELGESFDLKMDKILQKDVGKTISRFLNTELRQIMDKHLGGILKTDELENTGSSEEVTSLSRSKKKTPTTRAKPYTTSTHENLKNHRLSPTTTTTSTTVRPVYRRTTVRPVYGVLYTQESIHDSPSTTERYTRYGGGDTRRNYGEPSYGSSSGGARGNPEESGLFPSWHSHPITRDDFTPPRWDSIKTSRKYKRAPSIEAGTAAASNEFKDGGSSKQNSGAEPSRTTYTNSRLKTVTAAEEGEYNGDNDFHKHDDDDDDVYDDERETVTKSPEEWLERFYLNTKPSKISKLPTSTTTTTTTTQRPATTTATATTTTTRRVKTTTAKPQRYPIRSEFNYNWPPELTTDPVLFIKDDFNSQQNEHGSKSGLQATHFNTFNRFQQKLNETKKEALRINTQEKELLLTHPEVVDTHPSKLFQTFKINEPATEERDWMNWGHHHADNFFDFSFDETAQRRILQSAVELDRLAGQKNRFMQEQNRFSTEKNFGQLESRELDPTTTEEEFKVPRLFKEMGERFQAKNSFLKPPTWIQGDTW